MFFGGVGFNSYIFVQEILCESKLESLLAQSSASSFPFSISSLGVTPLLHGMCLILFPHPFILAPSSVSMYFPDNKLWFYYILFLIQPICASVSLNNTKEDHH